MDPSLSTAACAACETLINNALKFDPATKEHINNLTDTLSIECQQPKLTIYCRGGEAGIQLSSYCDQGATTTLRGSALALLTLLKQPKSLANTGVEVSGSVHLLQRWQDILNNLDIDWEDAISQILGDIAGPSFVDIVRKTAGWAQHQSREQGRLLKEFLTEETSLFTNKAETQHLQKKMQETTLEMDRIKAKLKELEDKVISHKTKGN